MVMTGRKRVYGGRMPMTKRRKTYHKRYRKTRRYAGNTSKSGFGASFNFKSKRLSRRRWNSALWNSTLQKQHVRSVFAVTSAILTQADPSASTVQFVRAVQNFWLATNGAQSYDPALPIGLFDGDLVIRGGVMGIRFTNDPADVSPVTIKLYLVRVGDEFDPANIPTSVSLGWDPSVIPNFGTNVGKVVMERSFLIENSNNAEVKYRLPIQKVDSSVITAGKNQYYWFIMANSANGIPVQVTHQRYYNLSFVGDQL